MGYFYYISLTAPPAPPPAVQTAESGEGASSDPTAPAAEPPPPSVESEPSSDAESEPAAVETNRIAAEAEQEIVVETDDLRVVFSNRGGVVKSWRLKNFTDSTAERGPLELIHQQGGEGNGWPFALAESGGNRIEGLDDALFTVNAGGLERRGPTTLELVYSDGRRKARKRFRFESGGYVIGVETELEVDGAARAHLVTWPGGFGDTAQTQDSANSSVFYWDPESGSVERVSASDAEDERVSSRGVYPFAGIDDLFFAVAFLPPPETSMAVEASAVEIAPVPDADQEYFAALALGGQGTNAFRVFVGPKSVDVLPQVDPRLRRIVDFGFLSVVAEPIFWMMRWTHANLVDNYGWTIVLVTFFINIVLFPLKWKSTRSMKRMQQIQPLVKQINEKYKGLGMRDPKKAQQNEETMALYKKYDVNPMGSCLPMLLQMPFFFAFYTVLTVAIEMRQAEWLWVSDLSAPETLAIRVLPLAMMGTQFWQQHLTPTPSADPAQAKMMKFMPLMMGFIFYQFQSGLVLYWLTSNVVGVGQQLLLNRIPGDELVIEQPRKRGGKKKK